MTTQKKHTAKLKVTQIIALTVIVLTGAVIGMLISRSNTLQPAMLLNCSNQGSLAISWSSDGKRVACGGDGGVVEIWDTTTGTRTNKIQAHQGWVAAIAWDDQSSRVASIGRSDKRLRIWDVARSQAIDTILIELESPTASLVWGFDDNTLAVIPFSGRTWVFDINTGKTLAVAPGGSISLWEPSTNQLAYAVGNTAWVTGKGTSPALKEYRGCDSKITDMHYAPDGGNLALLCGKYLYLTTTATALSHSSPVWDMAWSSDGKEILSKTAKELYRWNSSTGTLIASMSFESPDEKGRNTICWLSQGKKAVVSGGQWAFDDTAGRLALFDMQTSRLVYQVDHYPPNASIACQPNGTLVATESHGILLFDFRDDQ